MRLHLLRAAALAVCVLAVPAVAGTCPGSCVGGGGPSSGDCIVQWGGIDGSSVSCADGAPCDLDGEMNGSCAFPLSACLGVDPACPVTGNATAKVAPKSVAGGATLASAIAALQPGQCTTPGFVVPVKQKVGVPGPLKGTRTKLKVTVTADGTKDPDTITLTCDPAQPSFANDIQPIFTASCATEACHTAIEPAQGLNLEPGAAWTALVGVPASEKAGRNLVTGGNVKKSFIADKVYGKKTTIMPSGCTPGGVPACLTDAERYLLLAWIQAGAPNN